MIVRGQMFQMPEVARRPVVEYSPASIEARSQRIARLVDERKQVMSQWLEAKASGEKIPPQASERFDELTRQIEREYVG